MKQLSLNKDLRYRADHGGEKCVGKRKAARPVATKKAMHLVMRSAKAKGQISMLSPKIAAAIEKRLYADAKKNHVKIRDYSNVANHLHILVQPKTKEGFQKQNARRLR